MSMRKNNNPNDEHQVNGATARRLIRPRRPSQFKNHVKAHTTIIRNEIWYGDGPPDLGPQFTAKQTAERCQKLIKLLLGAAKKSKKIGDKELARTYGDLAKRPAVPEPGAARWPAPCAPEPFRKQRWRRKKLSFQT